MAKASAARVSKLTTKRDLNRTLAARPCGGCTTCCVTREVPELSKPEGVVCVYAKADGCAIHAKCPASCKAYECGWRLGVIDGARMRPDRLGVLLEFRDTHAVGILLLVATEVRDGALDAEMPLMHELAAKGYVLYLISKHADGTERRRMMGPEERIRAIEAAARRRLPLAAQ